jgi:hypothetical protein
VLSYVLPENTAEGVCVRVRVRVRVCVCLRSWPFAWPKEGNPGPLQTQGHIQSPAPGNKKMHTNMTHSVSPFWMYRTSFKHTKECLVS